MMKASLRKVMLSTMFVLLAALSSALAASRQPGVAANHAGATDTPFTLVAWQKRAAPATSADAQPADAGMGGEEPASQSAPLLLFPFSVGLIAAMTPGKSKTPCIVDTVYPTDDVVVADLIVAPPAFDADRTGKRDSTGAIQRALDDCARSGGGTVFLPVGQYRITGPLTIPSFVTLRGDWQDPDTGTDYGTILLADVESTQADTPALLTIGGSAGAVGLTIYYPGQDIDDVKPYPYTFYVDGLGDRFMLQTIQNCTVINGYKGIGACVSEDSAHEMMTIDNVKGTFLCRGATAYNQSDVGTWKNLTLSNRYWAEAGAGLRRADRDKIDRYTRRYGVGLALGDLEWTQFNHLVLSDYRIGIHIVPGKRIQFAGSLYDVSVTDCDDGLVADDLDPRWGMVIANSRIAGSRRSVVNHTEGVIKMTGVELSGDTVGEVILQPGKKALPSIDYRRTAPKPHCAFYPLAADRTGKTDIHLPLQAALDQAGATGGVVYLPAGLYRLDHPVVVPAGVELRGCSSVATREQGGNSSGTLILAYDGQTSQPDTATALVTLAGERAGVRGLRFLYPENSAVTPGRLGTCLPYAYTIRGKAEGVYAVNIGLSGAYNGIDFRGCNHHFIKKLVCCCYANAIAAGDCSGGWIEGCLQNGNMLGRNGLDGSLVINVGGDQLFPYVFDAITRPNAKFLCLDGAMDQTVFAIFAYGVNSLITSRDSTAFVCNAGADNLGGAMLELCGGNLTGVNFMRWNGESYRNANGRLTLYNRLTICDKEEENIH